jgi:hypothetical protein
MYDKATHFDKKNKEIIYNLLVIKGEALIKGQFLALKLGVSVGEIHSNFFTLIADQIDPLLVYFINDEITASLHERGPLTELQDEILNEYSKEEDFKPLEFAKEDLFYLFNNKTYFIIGSSFLDFKINTFSAFECYVVKLYENLISVTPRSNKNECKLIKLIEKYCNEVDADKKADSLSKIKDINFYISSAEKISYVLSKCKLEKSQLDDINKFIDYYRSQRNTVHNMGIHKGVSKSVTVEGIEINLEQDKPSYTSNHNSAIYACRKLMSIYEIMLENIVGITVS